MRVETNCQVDVELIHWERWKKTELHLLIKQNCFKIYALYATNESCSTMIFGGKNAMEHYQELHY